MGPYRAPATAKGPGNGAFRFSRVPATAENFAQTFAFADAGPMALNLARR
jgi:hypothetical protein